MEKKRKIDENYADVVINSFRQDDLDILPPKPETPASASTDNERAGQETASSKPSKKKPPVREAWQEYEERFIRESDITARRGRQTYIRPEFHDRIQKMLHVIGGNEVTIAAFLDNVLTHHFTLFQDEIAESFKRHMESYNL